MILKYTSLISTCTTYKSSVLLKCELLIDRRDLSHYDTVMTSSL